MKKNTNIPKTTTTDRKLQFYKEMAKALGKPIQKTKTVLPIGAALLMGAPLAEAAIVYSGIQNVELNMMGTAATYAAIDINGGGNDMEFRVADIVGAKFFQFDLIGDGNAFQGNDVGGYGYPYAKTISQSVNSVNQIAGEPNWGNTFANNHPSYNGNHWSGLTAGDQRFMGFRLNGDLYGWVRIQFNALNHWTIVDWAYEDVANTPLTPSTTLNMTAVSNATTQKQIGEVYPNPSSNGLVSLAYQSESREQVNITVFDQKGKEITILQKEVNTGNQTLDLDLSGLEPGLYFIKLEDTNVRVYRKVLIQ